MVKEKKEKFGEFVDPVKLAADELDYRCRKNQELEGKHRTRYHSSRVPNISMYDYIRRIAKYARCSPECLLIAIIYIDRYTAACKVPVTYRNIHRLYITSVLIAAKLRDDIYYSNAYYASIGGIISEELNASELDFGSTIRWATWVEPQEFDDYLEGIIERMEAESCGSFATPVATASPPGAAPSAFARETDSELTKHPHGTDKPARPK